MNEKLVIYLQANELATPLWSIGEGTQQGDLDALVQAAENREVIVLVPAEDVLLTFAKLPKMNRSRLLLALPYALEEQLIPDVESLHFATMPYQENGTLPVAVVADEKMQAWLAQLAEWGVVADVLVPINLVLPTEAGIWHAMVWKDALVRTDKYAGFVCDRINLVEFMRLALSESTQCPSMLMLQNYTNHAYGEALKECIEVREDFLEPSTFLDNLFPAVNSKSGINLLQGQYAPKRSRLPHLQVGWRVAAYLGAAFVALLFLNPLVSGFILSHRESQVSHHIQQIYKQFFPQASSVIAPKQRIEEKLQTLVAKAGENKLLQWLAAIGQGMQGAKSISLKRIDYHDNQLVAELSAGTPDALSVFTAYLTKQGLEVKQQNADLVGSRINATIVIR